MSGRHGAEPVQEAPAPEIGRVIRRHGRVAKKTGEGVQASLLLDFATARLRRPNAVNPKQSPSSARHDPRGAECSIVIVGSSPSRGRGRWRWIVRSRPGVHCGLELQSANAEDHDEGSLRVETNPWGLAPATKAEPGQCALKVDAALQGGPAGRRLPFGRHRFGALNFYCITFVI